MDGMEEWRNGMEMEWMNGTHLPGHDDTFITHSLDNTWEQTPKTACRNPAHAIDSSNHLSLPTHSGLTQTPTTPWPMDSHLHTGSLTSIHDSELYNTTTFNPKGQSSTNHHHNNPDWKPCMEPRKITGPYTGSLTTLLLYIFY